MQHIFAKFISLSLMVVLVLGVLALPVAAQGNTIRCTSFTGSPNAERITYYMGEGFGFMRARQFNSAVTSYSCVIQLDESYIGAYNQRAVAFTMMQDYENALEDYDRALSIDSGSLASLNNRAIVHAAMRNYDNALTDLNSALSLNADYTNALINRGVIHAIQANYPAAITDLERAISVSNIDDALAARLRGNSTIPAHNSAHAQAYAILGIVYSGFALENYNNYLVLRGNLADQRVQSAASALDARFNFDLRLDNGSWLLMADLTPSGEEAGS